jgi:hypothetical protein
MRITEHILLESDVRNVPELRSARKIHTRLEVHSRVRRRSFELALIDYYYLSVQTSRLGRPGSRYVLDLRFVDPALQLSRRIAWRWMTATAVLAVLAVAVASWILSSSTVWWRHDWLWLLGVLGASAGCAAFVSHYRTTKTLAAFSVNGRARLLEITGGVGSFQAIRRFGEALAAHARVSIRARRRSRAEHLRDEMREHLRLKEAGVLSEQQYETSKRRILARHA